MDHKFTVQDVEYCRHGGSPLLARIYQPLGEGPFPAVVEVHGGAWTQNDRIKNEVIHASLAESGVVVMAIDFRMPPVAKYPAAVTDVNLAIRWFKARAETFGSRADLVGGLGTSSGGHLLMLNVLRPRDDRFATLRLPADDTIDAGLAFAIVCWPVLDPSARYRMVNRVRRRELIDAHHAFWADENEMAVGNPQLILERGEAAHLPPLLIIQGTADENLTPDMAERFAAAYRHCGGSAVLEVFKGDEHAFIGKNPTAKSSLKALADMRSFVRACFLKSV